MIPRICISFVVFLLISAANSQDFYRKVIHNTDPQAKCLDGSPGSLFIHEGSEKDKFIIYFLGGGFCGLPSLADTLQTCYQRSKTDLGSSIYVPDTFSGTQGILAINQPLYKNWTKVIFNYCDGSLHQGDNQSPIEYKGTKLYFRGAKIVRSHFKWLIQKYQFDQASKIMITGGSAGAVASFLWGNYVLSIVKNVQAVYNSPDSGILLMQNTYQANYPLIQAAVSTLMTIAHKSEQSPIPECNKMYPGQEWKCIFIQFNYPFLNGKYLFVNSQYEWWGISIILQIKCLKGGDSGYTPKNCTNDQMQAIENYRAKYMDLVNKIRTKDRGIWSIACSKHVYAPYNNFYDSDSQRVPQKTGKTVKDAIQQFILENKINWTIDQNPWPSNQPCAY